MTEVVKLVAMTGGLEHLARGVVDVLCVIQV